MFQCKCGREFKSQQALNGHVGKCKIANPNYISPSKKDGYVNPMKGRPAWNKGLTKKTSLIVANYSESISKSIKNKKRKPLSDDTKQKLSIIMKEKYSKNPPKVAGRSKCGWYKGFYCRSSWELAYLIYHLEHNINIESVTSGFKYIWEGSEHTYFPDFYLPDTNTYVEIKGYYSKQSLEKTKQFEGNLLVLRYRELQIYLDYVVNKYGDDFVQLYESTTIVRDNKKQQKQKELEEKRKLKQDKREQHIEQIRQQLLNSDIDFSKFGWVGKAAIIINITPQKVNQWMKRNMLEFYNNNCFKRRGPLV